MAEPEFAHLAVTGTEIAVRVTPGARRNAVTAGEDCLRIATTAVPEKGKATQAARDLLAGALGVAKTRLVLVRGFRRRSTHPSDSRGARALQRT